jgi:hypothetical protein
MLPRRWLRVLYQCCIEAVKNGHFSPNVTKAKFLKTLKTPVFMRVSEDLVSLGVRGVGSSNLPVPTNLPENYRAVFGELN